MYEYIYMYIYVVNYYSVDAVLELPRCSTSWKY